MPRNNDMLYHAAIYLRLSQEDGDISTSDKSESNSISTQRDLIHSFLKKQPDIVYEAEFCDDGYTGTNFLRPDFSRMIDAVRQGEINCVVVKDLSRLGRNYVETGEFLENVCPFLGLRFIAVNDGFDSASATSSLQLAASLSNIINDFYAKDISRKVSSALRTKMEHGDYIGNWEKYGYLKDPANKNHLIINPETAPIVQMIYTWRASGLSYSAIDRQLNEMAIPSPGQYKAIRGIVTNNNQKSGPILWSKHILTTILSDSVYLGHTTQRKTGQCLYGGLPFSSVPSQDWITVENTHEPIIDQKLFETVQEINRRASEKAKGNYGKYDELPKAENLFGEKLCCSHCGSRMKLHRSFNTKRDRVYFSYICPKHEELGSFGCPCCSVKKQLLDEAVFQTIRLQMDAFLDTAQILHDLLAEKQEISQDDSRRKKIRAMESRIKNLRASLGTLYKDLKDGLLNDEEYFLQRSKYQQELSRLSQGLAPLQQEENDTEKIAAGTKHWSDIIKNFSSAAELSKELLDACVDRITVAPDGSVAITFQYKEQSPALWSKTCPDLAETIWKWAIIWSISSPSLVSAFYLSTTNTTALTTMGKPLVWILPSAIWSTTITAGTFRPR